MGGLEEVDVELDGPLLWAGLILYRDPNLDRLYLAVGNANCASTQKKPDQWRNMSKKWHT